MIERAAPIALALVVAAAASAQHEGPQASVRTIDGRSFDGVVTIDERGAVRVAPANGEATALTLGDLASLDVATNEVPPAVKASHRVWLRSGQDFPATRVTGVPAESGKPARVAIELPCGAAFSVPLTSLRALRAEEQPSPPTFAADLAEPRDNLDSVFVVRDGGVHRFSVTVERLDAQNVFFDLRGETRDFPLSGLAGIVFGANTGFAADRQGKPRVSVQLATGERLDGKLLSLGAAVKLRLDEGAVVEAPRKLLTRIAVASDRLAWLSELKPTVEQTPAFDRTWPPSFDRSPAGPGILIAGRKFERGLVVVPRTRLTFDLAEKYDVFEATIGIDDRGGPQAHAVLRVLVDGKVAFESPAMTLGAEPVAVRVPLARCKQLALEADFGKNYDLGDLCAFADARVVQQ